MYFNRQNMQQKNWRMVKSGKHFLFGCTLFLATGMAVASQTVQADEVSSDQVVTVAQSTGATAASEAVADSTIQVVSEAVASVEMSEVAVATPASEQAEVVVSPASTEAAMSEVESVASKSEAASTSAQASAVSETVKPSVEGSITMPVSASVTAAATPSATTAVTSPQAQVEETAQAETVDAKATAVVAGKQEAVASSEVSAPEAIATSETLGFSGFRSVAAGTSGFRASGIATRSSAGAQNLDYSNKEDVEGYIKMSYEVDGDTIHWTVVDNGGRKGNAASGYAYFTIPKDVVGEPTNWSVVQTHKDGRVLNTRNYWRNGDGTYLMGQNGRMNVYTGSDMSSRLTSLFKGIGNPAIKGNEENYANQIASRSQGLYMMTADNNAIRNVAWTITFDTKILDKSKPLDYTAGMQGTGLIGGRTNIMTGYADNFIDESADKFQAVAVKDKYTAKQGDNSFSSDPATYVTNKVDTPEFPNNFRGATTFAWKDGAPTTDTVGSFTKTVVVTYPSHYNQAPQEVTINFEVESDNKVTIVAPTSPIIQVGQESLNDREKQAIKDAFVAANPAAGISASEVDVTDSGEITVSGQKFQTNTNDGVITRYADIRKDYQVSWTEDKVRSTDPGFSWSPDGKTLIYKYDASQAGRLNLSDVLAKLKATPTNTEAKPALREVMGTDKADGNSGSNGFGKANVAGYNDVNNFTKNGEVVNVLDLVQSPELWGGQDVNKSQGSLTNGNASFVTANIAAANGGAAFTIDNVAQANGESTPSIYKAQLYLLPTDVSYSLNKRGEEKDTTENVINVVFAPVDITKENQTTPTTPVIPALDFTDKASTVPTDIVVSGQPAGSTVKLYDNDGIQIGEGVADASGNAKIDLTGSLPKGDISATTTVNGTESEKTKIGTATKYEDKLDTGRQTINGSRTDSAAPKIALNKNVVVYRGEEMTPSKVNLGATAVQAYGPGSNGQPTGGNNSELSNKIDGLKFTRDSPMPQGRNAATNGQIEGTPGKDVEIKSYSESFTARDAQNRRVTATNTIHVRPTTEKYDATVTAKTEVKNGNSLTQTEKDAVIAQIKKDNAFATDTTITVDDKGNATITYVDGSIDKIPSGRTINAPEVVKETAPAAPTVTANEDGSVVVTPSANADKVSTSYVPEGATDPVTVEATKGADGNWTVPAGSGVTVDPSTGAVTIPADKVKDGSTVSSTATTGNSDASPVATAVAKTPADNTAPDAPAIATDLTGKAGTKTPVEITGAEAGSTVKLKDKDGNVIGEGTADADGKVTITPTADIPEGNVTATATDKAGNESQPSSPATATTATTQADGVKDPAKTVVADPANLTDDEKAKVEDAVKKANPDATGVTVNNDGTTSVTFPDGSTATLTPEKTVEKDTTAPAAPSVATDLAGKAGTKTPVEITGAEAGSTVKLKDKDGNVIGEGTADADGKVTITPTTDLPAGNITATSTDKAGNESPASTPKVATNVRPDAPAIVANEDGSITVTPPAGLNDADKVKVTYTPEGSDKAVTIEVTKGEDGNWTTPATDVVVDPATGVITIPADKVKDGSRVGTTATKGNSAISPAGFATAKTPADTTAPDAPTIDTDLTGKAGTTDPVTITGAEAGSTVKLKDKDGNVIGEGTADADGKVTITPITAIPAGNVTATATDAAGNESDASAAKVATNARPDAPAIVANEDGSITVTPPAGPNDADKVKVTYTPEGSDKAVTIEVTKGEDGNWTTPATDVLVDPATGVITIPADKVKDGSRVGTTATKGNSAISPAGFATAKTPADTTAPDAPTIDTDLTGKAGTKTPVEITGAEPGSTVKLKDKDGNVIGEGTADADGKVTITPSVDLPAGEVTATSTDKAGNESQPSSPVTATDATKQADSVKDPEVTEVADPANLTDDEKAKVEDAVKKANPDATGVTVNNDGTTSVTFPDGSVAELPAAKTVKKDETAPAAPSISTDLAGKAGTKTPVEITGAEPGSTVKLKDKDGNVIGEGTADADGKVTITPTTDIPAGEVTATSTDKAGNESQPSSPVTATDATKQADSVKDPEVTEVADPANLTDDEKAKVEDAVKKANPDATGVTVNNDGTTSVTFPDGSVAELPAAKTVKKDETAPAAPSISTDLAGKAGTKTPVEITGAEPGSTVTLKDKDGNVIGTGVADDNGNVTITPTADLPAGEVTATSTDKAGNESQPSSPVLVTDAAPAVPTLEPKTDGSVEVTPSEDADRVEITYTPEGSDKPVTSVVTKDPTTGNWTSDNPDLVVDPITGTTTVKVTIPAGKVADDTPVSAKATKGNSAPSPEVTAIAVVPGNPVAPAVVTPAVTPVADPSNLTDDEKAKVAEEVKKANPTATDVTVNNDGSTTVTFPEGTATLTPDKTVKEADANGVKDPEVTEVADPANLTDDEKAKVEDAVKKANPDATGVTVNNDGTTSVTFPDGSVAELPAAKTVKKDETAPAAPSISTDLAGKAGTKTPVEITGAEPGSTVTLKDKDGNTIGTGVADDNGNVTITPTADIPAGEVTATSTDKAGNESTPSTPATATDATKQADSVKDPEVTEVADPANLTDAEKAKVADEVKKANPDATGVTVNNDGTTSVTFPDGSVAELPAAKTVEKDITAPAAPSISTDLAGKAGTKTPVEITGAEPGSTVTLKDKDGNTIGTGVADDNGNVTITPTVDIPAGEVTATSTDKAGNESQPSTPATATAPQADSVKDPEVTEVADPANLTDDEKAKVEDAVKKANPDATGVTVNNDGTTSVTFPDGSVAELPAAKTVKKDETAPAAPSISTDLAGKAGTKTPVEITGAEPGSTVTLKDKDGNTIGTGVADDNGNVTITPTTDLPAGEVTATSTDKAGNESQPSSPVTATDAAPAVPTLEPKTDGSVEVTPSEDADRVEITYTPEGSDKPVTSVVTKDPTTGNWTSDNPDFKVDPITGTTTVKVTIPADKVADDSPVSAKATKGNSAPSPEVTAIAVVPGNPVAPAVVTPAVTPVADPSNLTDDEKAKVAEEVKKANPTATDVTVNNDGSTTVTFPEGTATLTPDKTVKEADANGVKDPEVTEVADPANLTDDEKAKVEDAVKKANPNATGVTVNNDGTTSVTFPDGSVAELPAAKAVKKDETAPAAPSISTDLAGKAGTKTPVEITGAEPGSTVKLKDKDGNVIGEGTADADGKVTITPTADIPAGEVTATSTDKAGNESQPSSPVTATATQADAKGIKDPAKTEVVDPSNLTDAEKAKVADEVKKANPTATGVTVNNDGTTTVTFPDGSVAKLTSTKTIEKDTTAPVAPSVSTDLTGKAGTKTPVEITGAEPGSTVTLKDKDGNVIGTGVADENGKVTITPSVDLPEGQITATSTDKAGNESTPSTPATATQADAKGVKDPAKTEVVDPSNLTDAEKAKVADEVKKANPTATDVTVNNDGTTTVTFPDGSVAELPATKTVEKDTTAPAAPTVSTDLTGKAGTKTPVEITGAEPGSTVTLKDKDGNVIGTGVADENGKVTIIPMVEIPAGQITATSTDKAGNESQPSTPVTATTGTTQADGIKDPAKTEVVDPSNLTDAEKAKVADEVKKANPTATDVTVNNDGTTTVIFPDGSVAILTPAQTIVVASPAAVSDKTMTTPADKQAEVSQAATSQPTYTTDVLPETGDSTDATALAGLGVLGSLLLGLGFSRKKKED